MLENNLYIQNSKFTDMSDNKRHRNRYCTHTWDGYWRASNIDKTWSPPENMEPHILSY